MFQITQLDHLVLRVQNLQLMLQFYQQALGCTLERSLPELGLYQLRAGQQLIDLISVDGKLGKEGGQAPGTEGHNLAHFCLLISPFEPAELQQHFARFAIDIEAPEVRYGATGFGPSVYVRDPQGNIIELKAALTEPVTSETTQM
ncbi:VOC family protein [Rheinheimera sp. 4Y26]|uniref:VOC family protein n=1 Tax=Rheinheimera sp. 4Y26 TaxID=2977811 RepID=UPI0021B127B4|nr:VOC family protein [Rheinheimera sp. 4Y26]MCT6698748.1 VOC family protein [Rheinheimera sp. 4Y26]